MACILVFLLLTVVVTAYEDKASMKQHSECILKHMLLKYGESQDITLANMEKLLDAVTIGYHNGSEHDMSLSVRDGTNSSIQKRSIHTMSGDSNIDESEQSVCNTGLENTLHMCSPGSELLQQRGYNSSSDQNFNIDDFLHICPALVYQLIMTPCIFHPHTFLEDVKTTTPRPVSVTNTEPSLAWIGAISAVALISIVGVGIISIIPLMKRSFYHTIIQYLVALAVGTLVGDAMLHLLPHALSEHEELETDLTSSSFHVWRACVSLLGIFIFFNAERVLGAVTSMKTERRKVISMNHDDAPSKSESGSCGSCAEVSVIIGHSSREIREMASDAHKELHALNRMPCRQSTELVTLSTSQCQICEETHSSRCKLNDKQQNATELSPLTTRTPSALHSSLPVLLHSELDLPAYPSKNEQSPMLRNGNTLVVPNCKEVIKSYQMDNNNADHDEKENHVVETHGHSHGVPETCSSVAYMVIMGDGLHNFTDGLAIGAAFASSITGGMSTAIAVLCHELPHELGDFAMLLKAGMTVKQAYLCNLLSACLQLLGVVIGVAVGNTGSASQWLFAFAGGIFLYVGLVDMLPEISKVDHRHAWKQLLLQNTGLLTGFGLMLTIAIFETDIENAFKNF